MEETDSCLFGFPVNVANYLFYENRLKTFQNWPRQISPNKYDLAKAGLYYTGEGDIVKCFACGVRLHQWLAKDTALEEHRKWSPQCVFLKIIGIKETEDSDAFSFQGLFSASR